VFCSRQALPDQAMRASMPGGEPEKKYALARSTWSGWPTLTPEPKVYEFTSHICALCSIRGTTSSRSGS
jgi:hypothetical protein